MAKIRKSVSYGGMDTTNHIERHWEWIKYILLQGKVNRSLRDLIVAIIAREVPLPLIRRSRGTRVPINDGVTTGLGSIV